MTHGHDELVLAFEPQRVRLIGLAYRMLGSYAEAEDVVQDAFLRVRAVNVREIVDPPAYLFKTVARLCLDRMKSARMRRETYVGTWLPEPILAEPDLQPDAALELADDLSFALLLTLERLSPPERAAFLLHDVFAVEFDSVAQVLDRSSAACRKLAERARNQVMSERERFVARPEDEERLTQAFFAASATGDVEALTRLLAQDAVLYTDGGGKRNAALNPVYGRDRIARFFAGIIRKPTYVAPQAVVTRRVNQLPGCVLRYEGGDVVVAAIELQGDSIHRIYIVSNPDKLRHVRSS
jgi:RNA polymerase sigma-70 factor (ECF subfamily)